MEISDEERQAVIRELYRRLKEDFDRQMLWGQPPPDAPPVGILGVDFGREASGMPHRGLKIPIRRGRGMLNRAAALDAFLKVLDEDFNKEEVLAILREMHPFDLGDFQEGLDNLEELIIQVRGEKTVTAEMMEEEGRRF